MIRRRDGRSPEKGFRFLSLRDVMRMPPKRYLIEGLVPERELAMIYGPAKSGKTFLVIEIVAALLRGDCLLAGKFKVGQPVNVVYTTSEGQSGIAGRMSVLYEHHGLTPDEEARLHVSYEVPQLYGTAEGKTADDFIESVRQELGTGFLEGGVLVVDTWARSTRGADENTSKDTTIILDNLAKLRDALGCTVLVVHHANKGGDIRGSTNIQAGFDNVIHVRRTESVRTMGCAISKDAEDVSEVAFRIVSREVETPDGRVFASGVIAWDGEPDRDAMNAAKLDAELHRVLTEGAGDEDDAMTAMAVHERLAGKFGLKTIRERLRASAQDVRSSVAAIRKQTLDSVGRPNREADHYFIPAELP